MYSIYNSKDIDRKKIIHLINQNNIKYKIKKLEINQLNINGVSYDDSVIGKPIHKIKTNNIIKSTINIKKYLPTKIIDRYTELDKALDKLIKKQ